MEVSVRKYSKKIVDNVDDWLKDEGYYRKASPKDPTCLFRAVSEHIYMAQYYHIKVRKECVEFMTTHKYLFEKNIIAPIENYLEQLSCFTEWGGINEIEAMSLLYRKDFIIFNTVKMTKNMATNNGFKQCIYLCYTPPKHYEGLYDSKKIVNTGFCQSVIYKMLYQRVFEMPNVEEIAEKMLHDSVQCIPRKYARDLIGREDRISEVQKKDEEENRVDKWKVVTPFPYRIAKALDPNIYRNIDFDIWHEIKREVRNSGWIRWNNCELQVGGKCLVQLDYNDEDEILNNYAKDLEIGDIDNNGNISHKRKTSEPKQESVLLIGHIQEMSQNEGPVVVFIEELGEKKTVPYASLKALSEPKRNKFSPTPPTSPKKNSFDPNLKWRKQPSVNTRKSSRSLVTNPTIIPVLSSHVDLNTLDNDDNNNNNDINNENDNSDSVIQSVLETNSYNNTEANKAESIHENGIDDYPSCEEYSLNNTIQVQSSLTLKEHMEPMIKSYDHREEDYNTKSYMPNNKNSQINFGDKNIKNIVDGNGNSIEKTEVSAPVAVANETFCSQTSVRPPPGYPGNLNIVCVSPEGNVYAPFFYVGNNYMAPSVASILNCNSQVINFGAPVSVDVNGNDLPYSDIPTMRFFYNLGIEYFRCNPIWTANVPMAPVPCTQAYVPNEENIVPVTVSCASNTLVSTPNETTQPQQQQQLQQQQQHDDVRQQYSPNRRKNDRVFNNNHNNNTNYNNNNNHNNRLNIKPNGNSRNMYPRKYNYDSNYQDSNRYRNGGMNYYSSYDYQKPKYYPNNENRDFNNTPWEQRKNRGVGQYKKPPEDRFRVDKVNGHYEHQKKPSSINYQNNNNLNNYKDAKFHETKPDQGYQGQTGSISQNGHAVQSPSPVSSANHQTSFTQQSPPVFTSVPYYPNEIENMYPLPGNMYSVPYIPHSEADGNNIAPYCCPGLDNYSQPMPSIYPSMPFPPSSMLPSPPPPQLPPLFPSLGPPNSPENWYIPGQAHFFPYPQHFTAPSSVPPAPLQSSSS